MLIIFLVLCNTVIFAQEVTSVHSQTIKDESGNSYGVDWDSSRFSNSEHVASKASNTPQDQMQDYTLQYSNELRQFLSPVSFYHYNFQRQNDTSNDQIDNKNSTNPFVYPFDTRNQQFSPTYSLVPYPNPSASSPNLTYNGAALIRPAIAFTPAVSINVRRGYANGAVEQQNSSDTNLNDAELETSSYEEVYKRFIPPLPFTTMPYMMPSYMNFGYPRQVYPSASPAFIPPYSIIPSQVQELSRPSNENLRTIYYNGEQSVSDAPVTQDRVYAEQTLPTKNAVSADSPHFVSNPLIPLNPFSASFGRYPFGWSRPVIPAPTIKRDSTEKLLPVDVQDFADLPPVATNAVVPPNVLFPYGRFPFVWPQPVLPNIIPSPIIPKAIPPSNAIEPEISVPALEIPSGPVHGVDRLPIDSNVEGVLPGNPAEADTLAKDSLQAVVEQIQQGEKSNSAKLPYEFGFDMNDGKGTDQHRMESSDGSGTVRGSYGYRDLFGVYRLVNYIADKNGFRAFVKSNEPGVAPSGSADVIVQAEHPPPHAVAEATNVPVSNPGAVIVPDPAVDLIAEGSE